MLSDQPVLVNFVVVFMLHCFHVEHKPMHQFFDLKILLRRLFHFRAPAVNDCIDGFGRLEFQVHALEKNDHSLSGDGHFDGLFLFALVHLVAFFNDASYHFMYLFEGVRKTIHGADPRVL